MPWSRSACSASIRKAHSNGMPRRSQVALMVSNLPSGREPVSWNRRPTRVDLPWSTWPTMTILRLVRALSRDIAGLLQIAAGAQTLERVLGLVIHRATAPLGDLGGLQLGDHLVQGRRVAVDREGDVGIAQRPVALAVPGEIEIDQRNALALRIAPDVDLAPMQQRVHPDMGLGREAGHVLVPELGRLVLEVPAIVLAARAEVALLGARALLVAPDAGDQALEAVLGERRIQACGLARPRGGGRG